jgi:transposase
MTISELTLKTRGEEPVRRFEVFTGTGRRRDWSDEEKAQIVAESYSTDVTVCEVARRHGLSPQQLFTWRRLLRKREDNPVEATPMFVPAIVDAPKELGATKVRRARSQRRSSTSASIELEIDGATVRIASGADAQTIAAVVQALKASS